MKKVLLYPNTSKDDSQALATLITEFFTKNNIQCEQKTEFDETEYDALITLGGDGTIVSLASQCPTLTTPILGINMGTLGFMADVPKAELEMALQEFLESKYTVEKRITLLGELEGHKPYTAINDFVIHRGQNGSIVEINIHAGDTLINSYKADGVIIATPNGSTAYSLAAGGPILTPDVEAFVVTPISAHTISTRPIVLSAKHTLTITGKGDHPLEVIGDGLVRYPLNNSLTISRGKKTFPLVTLNRGDYFSTLRTKLGWSGQTPRY